MGRIAKGPAVDQVDGGVEHKGRKTGRPSVAAPLRSFVWQLVATEPDLLFVEFRQGQTRQTPMPFRQKESLSAAPRWKVQVSAAMPSYLGDRTPARFLYLSLDVVRALKNRADRLLLHASNWPM